MRAVISLLNCLRRRLQDAKRRGDKPGDPVVFPPRNKGSDWSRKFSTSSATSEQVEKRQSERRNSGQSEKKTERKISVKSERKISVKSERKISVKSERKCERKMSGQSERRSGIKRNSSEDGGCQYIAGMFLCTVNLIVIY